MGKLKKPSLRQLLQRYLWKLASATHENGDESDCLWTCKYPRTESLRQQPSNSNTTVNSLYLLSHSSSSSKLEEEEEQEMGMDMMVWEDEEEDEDEQNENVAGYLAKDLASATSPRFFFCLAHSNSILHVPETETDSSINKNHGFIQQIHSASQDQDEDQDGDEDEEEDEAVCICMGVVKYSMDPYIDFFDSIHHMLLLLRLQSSKCQWEMEMEYVWRVGVWLLTLNPVWAHPFIVQAFADVVLLILSCSTTTTSSSSSSPSSIAASPVPLPPGSS